MCDLDKNTYLYVTYPCCVWDNRIHACPDLHQGHVSQKLDTQGIHLTKYVTESGK